MITDELLDGFIPLHFPNIEVYGVEKIGAKTRQGGKVIGPVCSYELNEDGQRTRSFTPLDYLTVRQHLEGTLQASVLADDDTWKKYPARILAYQIDSEAISVATAIDLDVVADGGHADLEQHFKTFEDAKAAGVQIGKCAAALGLTPWLETTKSKGIRVWIYHERVPSEHAQLLGQLLLKRARLHQNIEVFPKQSTLGNLTGSGVFLPYYKWETNDRQKMYTSKGVAVPLKEFVTKANSNITTEDRLAEIVNEAILAGDVEKFVPAIRDRKPVDLDDSRPGAVYNRSIEWNDVLTEYGWAYVGSSNAGDNWCRPGKVGSTSGTVLFDSDLLHVFTDGVPSLNQGSTYSKFAFYVRMEHDGDYSAAARDLLKQGYGRPERQSQKQKIVADQNDSLTDEETLNALQDWNDSIECPHVYRRGAKLCDILYDEESLNIRELDGPSLETYILASCEFVKFTKQGEKAARIPAGLPTRLIKRSSHMRFPHLQGITRTPIVRSNGELLIEQGYDKESGLIYRAYQKSEDCIPPLDVAIRELSAVFEDVRFADEVSRVNAFAAILTPYLLPYINDAFPWFVVDAPKQGAGKTTVAQSIAAFAEPQNLVSQFSTDDYQMFNQLLGALMGGKRAVVFDNLVGRVSSAPLSQLITGGGLEGRKLGGNSVVNVKSQMLVLATANNANIDQDLISRAIYIRLDTHSADNRTIVWKRPNPLTYIRQNHGRLTLCVMAILEHWIDLGLPEKKGDKITRFDRWEKVIGGVLESIGMNGVGSNIEALSQTDDRELALVDFIEAWWDLYGSEFVAASDLTDIAFGTSIDPGALVEYFDREISDPSNRSVCIGKVLNKRREQAFRLSTGCEVVVVKEGKRRTKDRRAIWALKKIESTALNANTEVSKSDPSPELVKAMKKSDDAYSEVDDDFFTIFEK